MKTEREKTIRLFLDRIGSNFDLESYNKMIKNISDNKYDFGQYWKCNNKELRHKNVIDNLVKYYLIEVKEKQKRIDFELQANKILSKYYDKVNNNLNYIITNLELNLNQIETKTETKTFTWFGIEFDSNSFAIETEQYSDKEIKKYKLLDKGWNGLSRIVALIDIPRYGVKKGNVGGWVGNERNLSHTGDCWIDKNASVYGNAYITENVLVTDNVIVEGNAKVSGNTWIFGDARIYENARVFGNALIFGDAQICGFAQIYENGSVFGNARVSGNVRVEGYAKIYENAQITGSILIKDFVQVSGNIKLDDNVCTYNNGKICNNNQICNNSQICDNR